MSWRGVLGAMVLSALSAAVDAPAGDAVPAALPAPPPRAMASSAPIDARVLGRFLMHARLTEVVNVPGERAGQVLVRHWAIEPTNCSQSLCEALSVNRERSAGKYSQLTLRRVGVGRYAGAGSFTVPLECNGRTYPNASVAQYRLSVTVAGAVEVGGVWFARKLAATYVNTSRSDATPCPLGPSHDAALYTGVGTSALPAAPRASFTTAVDALLDVAGFADTSTPQPGGAGLAFRAWNFGDPRSGAANGSTAPRVLHVFSAPGRYVVSLTVVDASGLSATTTHPVAVGPLATSSSPPAGIRPISGRVARRAPCGACGASARGSAARSPA